MILSVSRRTDIPAFYTPWFMNRLREGFVLVRNPMNYHQVSKVFINPEVIDCIVFWTKNPEPLMPYLGEIGNSYPFYFQFTLNAYQRNMEPGLPTVEKRTDTLQRLSDLIGPERVVWRYDPILITDKYTIAWHTEQFGKLAGALQGYTNRCVLSFIDLYDRVKTHMKGFDIRECTDEEMIQTAKAFSGIAADNGIQLQTCAEKVDLQEYGISHGSCIDGALIESIIGWKLKAKKDPNQRSECGCIESIDIGQYNTCRHGCRYCYANYNPQSVATYCARHNPSSPFLTGDSEPGDIVKDRKMKSLKEEITGQIRMDLL